MSTTTYGFAYALVISLLCGYPLLGNAGKVRLYSDRYCGSFSAERTQSDPRLGSFNVWSMRVESGAWYARLGSDESGERLPVDPEHAYSPQDGCVVFKERVSGVFDAQWLVYEACGAGCRSEACAQARWSEDFRSLSDDLARLRDTGHVIERKECLEQIKTLSSSTRYNTASDVESCACECLRLHYALPPTPANRERIRKLTDNCAVEDDVALSSAKSKSRESTELHER